MSAPAGPPVDPVSDSKSDSTSGPVRYLGVDVGGSKVLAAEVTARGEVMRTAHRSTRGDLGSGAEIEDAIDDAVLEAAGGARLGGVGIALAGLVDPVADLVRYCTHLPWRGEPVRARLAARWGAPVAMDNDANCAAIAEHEYGAAVGVPSFLMITIGTGIGGAVVHGGRVLRGVGGMAGEFGHIQAVPDGLPCECGLRGCWEQYCSGKVLTRLVADARPDLLDGPAVTAAARDGDPAARRAFVQVGEALGVGVAALVSSLDPALVVVGGGVSAVGDLLLDPAREALTRSVYASAHRQVPPLVPARLGPEAGAIGAAHLARVSDPQTTAPSSPGSRGPRGIRNTR